MIRGSARAATMLLALAACLEAPPAGPEAPDACGTLRALADEFGGDGLDDTRWNATSDVSASGGAARITSTAGEYNTLYTEAFYQVSGGELVAELDVSEVADGVAIMALEGPDDFQVSIRLENRELALEVSDGDGEQMVDSAPLEQDHIWWRLREEAGQFFWATAADEDSWTERGPFPASIGDLARVTFDLTPKSDGALIIHAVNPGSGEAYCPAASFRDDFASLSPRWQVDQQGDCRIDVVGQARLAYSAQAFCAMTTRERFDLGDSAFAVELAAVGDCAPQPVTRVQLSTGENLEILCRKGADGERKLVAASSVAGELAEILYDQDAHRHVRLRHDPGADGVVYETSSGDGSWPRLALRLLPLDQVREASLRFFLGGETTGGFETVAFESVNTAP